MYYYYYYYLKIIFGLKMILVNSHNITVNRALVASGDNGRVFLVYLGKPGHTPSRFLPTR